MKFYLVIIFFILQRIHEIFLGRKNLALIKPRINGAINSAEKRNMIFLHSLWFCFILLEFYFFGKLISDIYFHSILTLLIFCQLIRFSTIFYLGRSWVPIPVSYDGQKIISGGPYKWVRHPNYLVVMIEIAAVPIIGSCYLSAAIFSILNFIFLIKRIKLEENALASVSNYAIIFRFKKKLIPFIY